MRATFELPVELGSSVIDAALEGLTRAAEVEVASGNIPPLATSGVRYSRENGETWLTPSRVLQRGSGDCEDLSAWRAAELRVHGADPTARAVVYRSGPRTWHAVVSRDGGQWYEDPSAALGMRSSRGAAWPAIEIGRADCPHCGDAWHATWHIDRARITGYGDSAESAIRADSMVVGDDDIGFVNFGDLLRPVADVVTSAIDAASGRQRAKPAPSPSPSPAPSPAPSPLPRSRTHDVDDPDVLRFAAKIARWLRRERARAIREVMR